MENQLDSYRYSFNMDYGTYSTNCITDASDSLGLKEYIGNNIASSYQGATVEVSPNLWNWPRTEDSNSISFNYSTAKTDTEKEVEDMMEKLKRDLDKLKHESCGRDVAIEDEDLGPAPDDVYDVWTYIPRKYKLKHR